jgi:hypothetical protein
MLPGGTKAPDGLAPSDTAAAGGLSMSVVQCPVLELVLLLVRRIINLHYTASAFRKCIPGTVFFRCLGYL